MAKNITKIEALPKFGKFSATPAKKKRVAAYARVSTDHDEQLTSFEAQRDYFQKMIENRVDWELVKIYADYGISAAGIKRRKQFAQMIQDCEDGKIDIVLVKSISRFARNTVDSLTVIRRLKELGIGIWFEKESLWTLDSKGDGFLRKRIQNDTSAYGVKRLEIRGFEGLIWFPGRTGSQIFGQDIRTEWVQAYAYGGSLQRSYAKI